MHVLKERVGRMRTDDRGVRVNEAHISISCEEFVMWEARECIGKYTKHGHALAGAQLHESYERIATIQSSRIAAGGTSLTCSPGRAIHLVALKRVHHTPIWPVISQWK